MPVLRKAGVRRLDLMLISHAHADHAGGALAVQRGVPVERVLSGEADALPPLLAAQPCRNGEQWQWNGVNFSTWRWDDARSSNESSCVLSVEASGERLLLTGDIESGAERALLVADFDVQAQWLQAPHHGSRTSSSRRFLERVAPEGVLISRGRHNNFGHPHPVVQARYKALGIATHDSAESGAISLRLGTFGQPVAMREQRRFWRD